MCGLPWAGDWQLVANNYVLILAMGPGKAGGDTEISTKVMVQWSALGTRATTLTHFNTRVRL